MIIKYKSDFEPGTGVVSQITWENTDMKEALKVAFGVMNDEIIVGLEVDELGIKAYFEKKHGR